MIEFKNVNVKFKAKNTEVHAVKNANLCIKKGEVFGIVGTSGAGKSTLLRNINLLQKPTSGEILISGNNITSIKGEELRKLRINTGMIFQHFNLIHTKTVFENIAFALKAAGKTKSEIEKRVPELLELVGLSERADVYPAKLSGGQKQRVGIARAIANNPEILLCDEPTSALDLETTNSILELLKDINKKLGITTVTISHELNVIKKICNRVAVMTNGVIVEEGDVFDIFANPKHEFTKQLVSHTLNLELPENLSEYKNKKILKIVYRGERAKSPVISQTVRKFEVDLNVLHGKIEYITDKPLGILLVSIEGKNDETLKAINYIKESTAEVEIING